MSQNATPLPTVIGSPKIQPGAIGFGLPVTSALIRRRAGGVLLRTPIAHPPRHIPDRDAALRET